MADRADIITQITLLSSLEKGKVVTQPSLAQKAKISLGFVNVLLKRAMRKGYVKVNAAPYKRFIYYMTPQGFSEKSRLVASYLDNSLEFFRLARSQYHDLLKHAVQHGAKSVIIVGEGELAEIALLALQKVDIMLLGIYDSGMNVKDWHGVPVIRDMDEICEKSCLLITDSRNPQHCYDRLCLASFDKSRILKPDFLNISTEPPIFNPPNIEVSNDKPEEKK